MSSSFSVIELLSSCGYKLEEEDLLGYFSSTDYPASTGASHRFKVATCKVNIIDTRSRLIYIDMNQLQTENNPLTSPLMPLDSSDVESSGQRVIKVIKAPRRGLRPWRCFLIALIAIETGLSITGTVSPLSYSHWVVKQIHSDHKNSIMIINHTDESGVDAGRVSQHRPPSKNQWAAAAAAAGDTPGSHEANVRLRL